MLIDGRDIRIDPWATEYGAETPGITEDVDDEQVEIDVETSDWREVVVPSSIAPTSPVAFVDGVRRIEARLVINTGSRYLHGAIGSYAVGAVRVYNGRAEFGEQCIKRVVIFSGGEHPGSALILAPGLIYEPISVADTDPDAPIRALHTEMRQREEDLANSISGGNILVLADGPLSISHPGSGPVIGFIKRLFRLYVGPDQVAVIRALSPGGRSPVFLIRSNRRFARYSWFTRLALPLRAESEFTGIVRLEIAETVGASAAIDFAQAVTGWLPEFVPSRTRDPRAPQNLVPIGALEQNLRHRLGDPRLIQRRLAALLSGESAHG